MKEEMIRGWCKKCDREVMFEKESTHPIFYSFLTFLGICFLGPFGIIIGIVGLCRCEKDFHCIRCGGVGKIIKLRIHR